ncbi:MAG: hypothetical protein AAFZ15_03285 [Bacteroidota bacterium]
MPFTSVQSCNSNTACSWRCHPGCNCHDATAQNVAGAWHYTAANGRDGGAGAAGKVASFDGASAYNQPVIIDASKL